MADAPIGNLPPIIRDEFNKFCRRKGKPAFQAASFESFASHLYLTTLRVDPSACDDILTGGMDDLSIDAILFLVNGRLIITKADFIAAADDNADLQLHFVQITSSQQPPPDKLDRLVQGSVLFMEAKPSIPENARIAEARALKTFIFDHIEQREGQCSPTITLTYIWPGAITRQIEDSKRRLEKALSAQYPEWESRVNLISAEEIEAIFLSSELSNKGSLSLDRLIRGPDIPGVAATYLGYVSGREVLSLVLTSDGKPQYSVFYDNVRSFLGWTETNKRISATLQNPIDRRKFILLNNGIVIAATDYAVRGSRLEFENYQIVNGCQTCNVLFRNAERVDDGIYLPVKVIICDDQDTVNKSIESTNRQNPPAELMLLSRHRYALRLSRYFAGSFPDPERIYFERQAKQYEGGRLRGKIAHNHIIALRPLLQAFAVLNHRPHLVYANHNAKLQTWVDSEELLSPSHSLGAYHLIALMIAQCRKLAGDEGWDEHPLRFHCYALILSLIRKHTGITVTSHANDTELREARAFVCRDDEIATALRMLEAAYEQFSTQRNQKTYSYAARQKRFSDMLEGLS